MLDQTIPVRVIRQIESVPYGERIAIGFFRNNTPDWFPEKITTPKTNLRTFLDLIKETSKFYFLFQNVSSTVSKFALNPTLSSLEC